jgi:hypothetical protein
MKPDFGINAGTPIKILEIGTAAESNVLAIIDV